jgi:energy-converting hydrogenase Eha subunit C
MTILGIILYAIGGVVLFVGYVWLVVVAFREGGAGWGIGSLLIGLIGLIFAITHWDVAKRPFLIEVAGGVVLAIGGIVFAIGASSTTTTVTSLLT